VIIYFHGFYGSPKKKRADFFTTISDSSEYYEPFIDYQNPTESIEELRKIIGERINKNHDDTLMFVGSSLGGFVAQHFCDCFAGKLFLINPSLKPWDSLLKYEGYTKEKADEFRKYNYDREVFGGMPTTVLLDITDDVIDPDYVRKYLTQSSHVIEIEEDGHRFSKYEKYRYIFERAYNNICG